LSRVETDLCNPTDIFDPAKSASVTDKQARSIAKRSLREFAILHLERAHGVLSIQEWLLVSVI